MTRHFLSLFCIMLLAKAVEAQQLPAPPVRMTLVDCIARALEISPDVEQARINVKLMEARLGEARSARFAPHLQLTQIFGPAPGIDGDPNNVETIRSDLADLGVFSRTSLELVQPIYTFGKIGGAQDAARAGLAAGEAGVERKKDDVVLQIKKLYHGMVLARDLREVVLEGDENVKKARRRVNEMLEEDSDDVSQTDLFKIDIYEYEIKKNLARADKSIELGKSAFKQLLGFEPATDFDVVVPEGETEISELEPLEIHIRRARSERDDMKQLRSGLQARKSLLRVSKSDFYPQIAIAGRLEWGTAPHRPHFSNPFLNDQFNFFRAGAVLTLRQSFNFGLTNAKHQARRAEYEDLVSKEEQAERAVALEVERAYKDVEEAAENVTNSDRATRSAKSWMTSERLSFDVSGDSSGLLEAYTAYAKMLSEFHQAKFNLNVTEAVLEFTSGVSRP